MVAFGMRPDDAWNTTMKEFWLYHDMRVEVNDPKPKPKIKDRKTMDQFLDHLRSMGHSV